ncbi:MAG: hypothetical protein OXF88_07780 [Rhodobacteraceae bacterium]|nr:hypothetical protein [Paracoccaceae bacterium]
MAHPDLQAIAEAAAKLAAAKKPPIIFSRGDVNGEVSAGLMAMAEENSIAVREDFVTRNVLPTHWKNGVGGNTSADLPDADVVLEVDVSVAWIEPRPAWLRTPK